MARPTNRHRYSVHLPSIGAISNQALYLIDSLEKFDGSDCPEDTARLRNVLLSIACHVRDELEQLHDPHNPLFPKDNIESLYKTRSLALVVRKLFAMNRYLDASMPVRTPRGIQIALRQLARFVVPSKKHAPLLVVRPQWHYNVTYVAIDQELHHVVATSVVATNKRVDVPRELKNIWRRWREEHLAKQTDEQRAALEAKIDRNFPSKMGILSFAGLDTSDSLLSPLLAHELGHFIDYNNEPMAMHRSGKVLEAADEALIACESEAAERGDLVDELIRMRPIRFELRDACMREIVADFLALRMMGLSYFIALAEFLKTLHQREEGLFLETGYPETKLRLHLLYEQMRNDRGDDALFEFLRHHRTAGPAWEREVSEKLLAYLQEWERDFARSKVAERFDKGKGLKDEILFLQRAARGAIRELGRLARKKISNKRRAVLTPDFFVRVGLLRQRRPPAIAAESNKSFPEICTAAWVYQALYGDSKERDMTSVGARRREYDDTCRLVMEAIDAIPDPGPSAPAPPRPRSRNSGGDRGGAKKRARAK